jgi:hypothetical protein
MGKEWQVCKSTHQKESQKHAPLVEPEHKTQETYAGPITDNTIGATLLFEIGQ